MIMRWLERLFAPAVKTRIMDALEQQIRSSVMERSETAIEREKFLETLSNFQASYERLHASTTQMVGELSQAILKNGEAFNKYLELITPNGEPQVRFMSEAREAALEAKLRGEHLGEELPPTVVPDHLVDQLTSANDITQALREFVGSLD